MFPIPSLKHPQWLLPWIFASLVCPLAFAEDAPSAKAPAPGAQLQPKAIAKDVLGALDPEANPCQDFYRYACGNWLDSTPMPADQARWARSFSSIQERNRELIREILEQAQDSPQDDEQRLIGTYYQSCNDEKAIEDAGTAPLRPWFEKIDAIGSIDAFLTTVGQLHQAGIWALFDFYVDADYRQPDVYLAQLSQGGLGLPEKDYYLSPDPAQKELRETYRQHIAQMLLLSGLDPQSVSEMAEHVLALETRLAEISRSRTEMRDIDRLYQKVTREELERATPGLRFSVYLQAIGQGELDAFNLVTPEFFSPLGDILTSTELPHLKHYLRWMVLHETADQLPQAFVEADFAFFGTRLAGRKELQPRWKRCVRATERNLGDLVGKLYIDQAFAGDSKTIALQMIRSIEGAFEKSLEKNPWMDPQTRGRATEKLHAIRNKIGYPNTWRTFQGLKLEPDAYLANSLAVATLEFGHEARKIGQPVDLEEWAVPPQTINAYYNPSANEIAFPAGILQPPFFHRDFPKAMNFGAIGAVMGHELTHGFDDQGRKFDPEGRLREWWEPEVSDRFEARAQCVEESYGQREIIDGIQVNGKLTLGENIADIGGVKQAFQAFQSLNSGPAAQTPSIPGLTDEQLFFVSYAQIWCVLQTPESLKLRGRTDAHAPPHVRVNETLSHIPEFAEAFACSEDAPMRAKKVCSVW